MRWHEETAHSIEQAELRPTTNHYTPTNGVKWLSNAQKPAHTIPVGALASAILVRFDALVKGVA